MDVHEESKPEGVHEVEDGPFFAVQKAKTEKVAVEEIEKRPYVEGHLQPEFFHLQSALVGIAEPGSLDRFGTETLAALKFLGRKLPGVSTVFLDPKSDVVFFAICLDKIVPEAHHRTVHVKVVIDQVVFIDKHGLPAEQLEQVLRVVAAVFDPFAAKDLLPPDEHTVDLVQTATAEILYLLGQLGGDALICIESQNPLACKWEVGECPQPLARVRVKGMLENGGSKRLGDFPGFIRTARIDNEDLQRPIAHAAQAWL